MLKLWPVSIFIALHLFFILVEAKNGNKPRSYNSFAYITYTNEETGRQLKQCVNYAELDNVKLATNFESAVPLQLTWWNKPNDTNICPFPGIGVNYSNHAIPLDYRVRIDASQCSRHFIRADGGVSGRYRDCAETQRNEIQKRSGSAAMFLLEKGSKITNLGEYLFSGFYDPFVDSSRPLPTFYLYTQQFHDALAFLGGSIESISVRFYRPNPYPIDPSLAIIWIYATATVTLGGIWAFFRRRERIQLDLLQKAEQAQNESNDTTDDDKTEEMDESVASPSRLKRYIFKSAGILEIVFLVAVVVGLLMLGYYYRSKLIFFFNILLVIFGTIGMGDCVVSLISLCKQCHPTPRIIQIVVYVLSFAFCLTWYLTKEGPYSFILLNTINFTVCLSLLKTLDLTSSLKYSTIMMTCMFVYDAFMVFGSRLVTKNGCSIMLQVATGVDCSQTTSGNSSSYPMAPIMVTVPEKFPMLIEVPFIYPMMDCVDLAVERGYNSSILGLGDILVPGILISHLFSMKGFKERVRLLYGFICATGYGIGLLVTFGALSLMKTGQPALIYLVPCTLIPTYTLSWFRKEFKLLWNGVTDEDNPSSLKSVATEESKLSLREES